MPLTDTETKIVHPAQWRAQFPAALTLRLGDKVSFAELAELAEGDKLKGLKWFSVQDVSFGRDADKVRLLARALEHMPALETFVMSQKPIGESMPLLALSALTPSLRALDLTELRSWPSCAELVTGRMKQLEVLTLHHCLDMEAAARTSFSHPFPPTLRSLDLGENNIGPLAMAALEACLRQRPLDHLERLVLDGNDLGTGNGSYESLLAALAHVPKLKVLSLKKNGGLADYDKLQDIKDAVPGCKVLFFSDDKE